MIISRWILIITLYIYIYVYIHICIYIYIFLRKVPIQLLNYKQIAQTMGVPNNVKIMSTPRNQNSHRADTHFSAVYFPQKSCQNTKFKQNLYDPRTATSHQVGRQAGALTNRPAGCLVGRTATRCVLNICIYIYIYWLLPVGYHLSV